MASDSYLKQVNKTISTILFDIQRCMKHTLSILLFALLVNCVNVNCVKYQTLFKRLYNKYKPLAKSTVYFSLLFLLNADNTIRNTNSCHFSQSKYNTVNPRATSIILCYIPLHTIYMEDKIIPSTHKQWLYKLKAKLIKAYQPKIVFSIVVKLLLLKMLNHLPSFDEIQCNVI